MKLHQIDTAIKAVCPIYGINSDGVIWFMPEATNEQKALAQSIMDSELPNLDSSV